MNQRWNKYNNQKGFTLVELMIVIAILGVLTAVLVPSISGYVGKARQASNIANAQMIYTASQLYVADQQFTKQVASSTVDLATLVTEGYLNAAPKDATVKIEITQSSPLKIRVDYQSNSGDKIVIENGVAQESQ